MPSTLGNHKALPFTGAWVSRKNCKRQVSGWLEALKTSSNKGPVNGFKRVATMHPEL